MRLEKKISLFLILCFLTAPAFLAAQPADRQQSTAQEIETLLGTNAVTYAQAARFALEASDRLAVPDHNEAFRYAAERGWLPKNVSANDTARLDGISLLLMRSFNMGGGILYSITKSPHYAYRELVYREVIRGRADPAMNVSGELFLFLTGRILSVRGDTAAAAPQATEAAARREELAAEINTILEEQHIADTVAEATGEGIMIRLSNIQFEPDSTVLMASERQKLVEISNILRNFPGRKIQVAGHTAAAGSVEGQRTVSLERARVIANYLVSLGACKAEDIIAVGFGSERPLAGNNTAEGMARNRRVEITIREN
jgi:outer membrane protein OmpA-like peptidoglycan-associated protein